SQVAMEYLCILNAFEQNYYNRIKEIERLAAAAAAAASSSSSASSTSSAASTSSASCSSDPSSSSSSPTSTAREMAQAAAALAATQRLAAYQGHGQGQGQGAMLYYQQHHPHHQQLQQQHPLQAGSAHQPPNPQSSSDPNSSNMANSLLWQPWRDLQQAAAMHHQLYKQHQQQQQQLHKEMRVTAKELPTTKWRRERRQRAAGEYHFHDAGSSDKDRELELERQREREERDMDSPIDMSVSSGALKHRASPPPPYREPLPGTVYTANSRPSVITQAPPKREPQEQTQSSDVAMCDIDEHFRRSLGENYAALFAKKSPTPTPTPTPSPGGTPKQQVSPLAYGPAGAPSPAAAASHLYHQHRASLAKAGLPLLHSPTLRSAPESPQPELPPPQEEPLPLSLAVNRSQTPPSQAGSVLGPAPASAPAATSPGQVVVEAVVSAKRILDTPHHTPPRYSTPPLSLAPPAYGVLNGTAAGIAVTPTPSSTPTPTPTQIPTPSSTPTMPAIIRVKAEPGLAAAAASSPQTPPASPTSSTNISIFTKPEASVDDHFAKALGETWKKLQGGHKE
ncbi:hypothetical protein KR009_008503, partial [Drosophila setifemur]